MTDCSVQYASHHFWTEFLDLFSLIVINCPVIQVGISGNALVSIYVVTLRQAWLFPRWGTVLAWLNHCSTKSTQPEPSLHGRCNEYPRKIGEVKVKERIVLREIHLRTTGRHLSTGSHSVICHPTEVTAPPSPQPGRLVLDLSTP